MKLFIIGQSPLIYAQGPNDRLDYTIDWTAFLDGDTIESSAWSCDDATTEEPTNDETTTTVWVKNAAVDQDIRVTNRITTANGRVKEASLVLRVREH